VRRGKNRWPTFLLPFAFEFFSDRQTKGAVTRSTRTAVIGPLLFLLAATGVARAAGRERPIFLYFRSAEALPFSTEELAEAVSLRAAVAAEPEPAVVLLAIEPMDGGVQVQSATRSQFIPLGGSQGKAAARLVALAIVDVCREPLAGPPPTFPLSLAVAGGSQLGLTNGSPDLELTIAGRYRFAGAWSALVELGYSRSFSMSDPVVQVIGSDVVLHTVPVRLGISYRKRWFEIGGGVVARPYFAARTSHQRGLLPGAFALAAVSIPLSAPLSIRLAAGCEGYPIRQSIYVDDGQLLQFTRQLRPLDINHVAPFVAAGIQWQ
jgi:hypothetical protein